MTTKSNENNDTNFYKYTLCTLALNLSKEEHL